MRENVAETADTADSGLVGINQGILAYFRLFNYSSLSKYCHISVKIGMRTVQFYLRRIQCSVCLGDVRFRGNRKARNMQIFKI